jgi:hypothetical protein
MRSYEAAYSWLQTAVSMTNLTGDMIHSTLKVLLFLCIPFTLLHAADVPKAAVERPEAKVVVRKRSLHEVLSFCMINLSHGTDAWVSTSPDRTIEADGDTGAELVQFFHKLPQTRQKEGIYIVGSITFLRDVEASKDRMSDFQKQLINDSVKLADMRRYVADLTDACNKAGVSLWINTAINGSREDMEFKKLTQ